MTFKTTRPGERQTPEEHVAFLLCSVRRSRWEESISGERSRNKCLEHKISGGIPESEKLKLSADTEKEKLSRGQLTCLHLWEEC